MIDCNDCPHLSITEEQQERLWRAAGKKQCFHIFAPNTVSVYCTIHIENQ